MFLAACDSGSGEQYAALYDIDQGEWSADQAINFDFTVTDTISHHDIDIVVRYVRYEEPLMLEIKTISSDNRYWCDTINITPMPNKIVRFSTHTDLMTRYRNAVQWPSGGKHSISIKQLTSPDTLRTVSALGVIISK